MPDDDRRVTELEIALAHHEAALDDLSAVVRDQGVRLDRLGSLVESLARRLADAEAGAASADAAQARPPQW